MDRIDKCATCNGELRRVGMNDALGRKQETLSPNMVQKWYCDKCKIVYLVEFEQTNVTHI